MNIADLRRYAAKGMTLAETAALMGYSYQRTSLVARQHGIRFDRPVKHGTAQKTGAANPRCKADPARVRDLAADGLSQSTIADILGVSRERIRQICDRDGIETLSGKVAWDRRDKLFHLSTSKMSAREAAVLAGYAAVSAPAVFRRAGLVPPKRETNADRYRECAAAGMTLTETARHFGHSVQMVWNESKRCGVVFTARHKRKSDRKFWTDDECRILLDLADAGEPTRALADQFGVSAGAIVIKVSALRRKAVAA